MLRLLMIDGKRTPETGLSENLGGGRVGVTALLA